MNEVTCVARLVRNRGGDHTDYSIVEHGPAAPLVEQEPTHRSGRRRVARWLVALGAVALGAVALLATACGGSEGGDAADPTVGDDRLSGYTREPTPSVAEVDFPLIADAGMLPAAAPEGGLRIVYFGYTSCPDVCPTTMVDLKRALADLPEDERDRVEVLMVTVDPDRDVDEKLDAYVTTFVPDGAAARFTDPEGLAAAAEVFGVQYSVETDAEGEIEVGHSGDLYAVDDNGDVVLQWPFGTSTADLTSDISSLLGRTAST